MFGPRTCFVDVETTGTDPARDRITEVAVVTVDCDAGRLRTAEWSSLVNPGVAIPSEISWLTGISEPMVRSAPSFSDLAERLYDAFEGAVFVAHNARFDFGFLKSEFARAGIAWTARILCTVRLSRRLYPDRGNHSLDAIAARFGLDDSERHRALGDARLLWRFVQRLYERMPRFLIEEAVQALLVRPGLPVALGPDALDRIPAAPGVYVMIGAGERTLYVGKSIDLRARIAAHFGADAWDERSLRLAREVERLDWERTAGEIGALLRESQLVKQRLPEHNVRLRRRLGQGVLRLQDGKPRWTRSADLPASEQGEYFGPFGSRGAARAALIRLASEHGLCPRVMGLEGRRRGAQVDTPCFQYQLRRCPGACIGLEPRATHEARLREALAPWRLPDWPCETPIALVEDQGIGTRCDWHVIDRWRWLGTTDGPAGARALMAAPLPAFDADEFRILREALERARRGQLQWIELR